MDDEYYSEDEVADLVDDFDDLREYLYGLPDAIRVYGADKYYKKRYVDTYVNR